AKWLTEHHHPGHEHSSKGWGSRIHRRIEHGLNLGTRQYERLLAWSMRHRVAVLSVVAFLFLGSLALTFGIGREFFPQVDAGQITMHVRPPSRSRLDDTEGGVIVVERFLVQKIAAAGREMIVTLVSVDPNA